MRGRQVEECEEFFFCTLSRSQAQGRFVKIQYGRASSFIFASAVSAQSRVFYDLMAAGTQTSRCVFMAPLWPGEMSSLDCTSGTGGRRTRTLSGLLSEQNADEEAGRRGHARGGINQPMRQTFCLGDTSSPTPWGHRARLKWYIPIAPPPRPARTVLVVCAQH